MSGFSSRSHISKLLRFPGRFPFLFFSVWAAFCSFPYWILGRDSYVRIFDNADSTLGAKLGLASTIAKHGFSLWWPAAVSGADTVAQAVACEADMLLFLILPGWLAYGLLMFLQRFIAGYFMYLFARKSLQLREIPSLYAGMAYALFAQLWLNVSWNGFTTYDGLALPGLPFVLLALHAIISRSAGKKYLWAGLLGAHFALTSYLVFTFFMFPLVVCWLLWVSELKWRDSWKPLAVFAVCWLVLELPAQIPAILNAPLSHRADWTAESLWYGWAFQFRLVWNTISQNALPLSLAFIALPLGYSHSRRIRKMLLLIAVVFGALLTLPYIATTAGGYTGFLRGVSFMRVFLNLPFLFITAGAAGLDAILSVRDANELSGWVSRYFRRFGYIPAGIAVLALLLTLVEWGQVTRKTVYWWAHGSRYSALYEQPQMQKLARSTKNDPPFRVATIAPHGYASAGRVALMPLFNSAFLWHEGFETPDGYVLLYPQRYQDYWELAMKPLFTRNEYYRRRFHNWGNQVYLFYPIEEIHSLRDTIQFAENYNLDMLSLFNVRFIVSNLPITDSRLRLVSDGSRYLDPWLDMPGSGQILMELLQRRKRTIPLYIYENPECFQRFFAVSTADVYSSKTGAMNALAVSPLEQLRRRIVIEQADCKHMLPAGEENGKGTVSIVTLQPDRIQLNIDASAGCYLVASMNYSPFWNAAVDGVSADIIPVNLAMLSVYIPSGVHRLTLTYCPPYSLF